MATFSYSNSYGALQNMLLSVLTDSGDRVISSTSSRIDYGDKPMRDPYTQFYGYGMNGTTSAGVVNHIDIYWPNVGSLSYVIDGLPEVPLAELFAAGNTAKPLDTINHILARVDWTAGYGTNYGESFHGFYSAETIYAEGGDDFYRASMAPGQMRNIVDHFDGGEDLDSVTFSYVDAAVTVDMEAGTAVFSEEVGGGLFSRTLEMVSVEDVTGSRHGDTMSGSAGADNLFGAGGGDRIYGLNSWDSLYGHGGGDFIDGGNGNATINGGAGKDVLLGQDGDDTIDGGGAADILRGGRGDDSLDGGKGADTLYGGKGSDTVSGGRGGDVIEGNNGNDYLYGGGHDDKMTGGSGADYMSGGKGNDVLRGKQGADEIDGNRGADRIFGDNGDDQLSGGGGTDRFVFRTKGNTGDDVITDFRVKQDTIVLKGANDDFDVHFDGADTVIDYAGGTIRLWDVHLTETHYDVIV